MCSFGIQEHGLAVGLAVFGLQLSLIISSGLCQPNWFCDFSPPCPWCSHSTLNSMQPTGRWDKETPDTMTKLYKPLLGYYTNHLKEFYARVYKIEFRNYLDKCHLIVFTQPQTEAQACVQCPLSASLARNHVKRTVYKDRERNNLSLSQVKSSDWDFRGTVGFEAEQASQPLTKQSYWYETMGDKMHAQTIRGRPSFKLETW